MTAYWYGDFAGQDPLCPVRLDMYPELRYLRDLSPEQLKAADKDDLIDGQHQWMTTSSTQIMQRCGELTCKGYRPVPLDDHHYEDQFTIYRIAVRNGET